MHQVAASLRRPLTRFLDARIDYRYALASSNLPAADYRQNVVSFSFGVRL